MESKPNDNLQPMVVENKSSIISPGSEARFFAEISAILQEGRNNAYRAINSVMAGTYWKIGRRIVEQEQNGNERADYGDYLIVNLSRYLSDTFGKGFSEANLRNFRRFYLVIPDFSEFDTQCVANLTWSNIRQIIRLDDANLEVMKMMYSREEILDKIKTACNILLDKDRYLLREDANERSITHKLAEYLEPEFPGWDIDCEYNRDGSLPKKLNTYIKPGQTDDTDAKTVYPDIIIHHRGRQGADNNFIVIETKKDSYHGEDYDLAKLTAYKKDLAYQFAFKITFPTDSNDNSIDVAENIREVNDND
jgi:hypothetical protein